jgi:hypothetical protein
MHNKFGRDGRFPNTSANSVSPEIFFGHLKFPGEKEPAWRPDAHQAKGYFETFPLNKLMRPAWRKIEEMIGLFQKKASEMFVN